MTLLRTLEKRHDALKTRLALVRIHPDVQLGQPGGVTHLLDAVVEQELRRLSADETTKDNLNQLAEPFAAKGKGDKGAGKGAPGPKTLEARRHVPCPYMDKPGGCSFGDKCHYRHDMPDKPHPKAKPKPKAEAKKKCIFHNRQGGCKLGFKCKFTHEGPSGAAKADRDPPEQSLVGGEALQAQTKAKPKPKPKAKASAASSSACMFSASASGDWQNLWPYKYIPNWSVFVSDLTPEQFAYWREHPDLASGSFRVVEDSHSLEIETWLTLREAYLAENFGDQPIHLRGTTWAVDMGLATAWCQTTSHHEPVFLVHAFDHVSAQERWFAVTQAVTKPGISEEERHDSEAVLTTWDETSDVSDVTVDSDAEVRGSSGLWKYWDLEF